MEYTPIMVCESDRTSFHEAATATHVREHGSTVQPCSIRMATAAEHERAGWAEMAAYLAGLARGF